MTCVMGENICKCYDRQVVNIQNTQTSYTTQYQKTNNPILDRRP